MKNVFMWLYGPLETDTRVLRAIDAVLIKGYSLTIVTSNTSSSFSSEGKYALMDIKTGGKGLVSYFLFVIKSLFFYYKNRGQYDIIYLHDYYSTFPGWILSIVSKKDIIYDAHELLINSPDQKLSNRENFFIWFEKHLVKKAKWVIEANKERESIIKDKYQLSNTTNVMNISKYSFQGIKRTLDKEEITLVYQGAITESRNLSFFISSLTDLPHNVNLLFIGDGPSLEKYKKEVVDRGLSERVDFTGRLSNSQMMERLKRCSIGVISYSFNGLNNIYCSPNKIFEYAAISLPFISTNQPFIEEVAVKYHIGRTFKPNDRASYISSVLELIQDYCSYTQNASDFLQDYSYEKEMKKLIDIL